MNSNKSNNCDKTYNNTKSLEINDLDQSDEVDFYNVKK